MTKSYDSYCVGEHSFELVVAGFIPLKCFNSRPKWWHFKGLVGKCSFFVFPAGSYQTCVLLLETFLEEINPSFHHMKLRLAETLPQIDLVVTMAFQDFLLLGQEYHGAVVGNDLDQPHNHKSRN